MIPLIPPVSLDLRAAAKEGKLIPFIGAGASKIAGCPNWSEFADEALRWMINNGTFSYGRLDQITHLNPRVKLSIALGLQEEAGLPIDFGKLLHAKDRRDCFNGIKLYDAISKLANSFVTTNYDRWLDEYVPLAAIAVNSADSTPVAPKPTRRRVIYKKEDLAFANLNQPNTVIHLHGTVDAPESMILTTKHYINHYANDRGTGTPENIVLTFLDHLFHQKTVLFIGYGLEELEILEYVISNVRVPAGGKPKASHYLLQGFFKHQAELMRSLEHYYLEGMRHPVVAVQPR